MECEDAPCQRAKNAEDMLVEEASRLSNTTT